MPTALKYPIIRLHKPQLQKYSSQTDFCHLVRLKLGLVALFCQLSCRVPVLFNAVVKGGGGGTGQTCAKIIKSMKYEWSNLRIKGESRCKNTQRPMTEKVMQGNPGQTGLKVT